jgi:tRNA 2-selenouridine synthase
MIEQLEIGRWLELLRSSKGVLLDARSEGEHAQGHIPSAISFPLLNNEERHEVGITYKQMGNHEAVKKGFALVGHKFEGYIRSAEKLAPQREVFLYCWRGGMRSNIMAWLLDLAGFRVFLLRGGYKSYRHLCIGSFQPDNRLIVLGGKTGSGKTEILHALAGKGAQVLDLEALASHKGSAFGAMGQPPAPTQEHFENKICWVLSQMGSGIIWIEGESRFIGRLRIPDTLFERMLQSEIVELDRSFEERIERIIHEYGNFPAEQLLERTRSIQKRMGGENVKESVDALMAGDMRGWAQPLLRYYDRTYAHSAEKNMGKKLFNVDITGMDHNVACDLILERMNAQPAQY